MLPTTYTLLEVDEATNGRQKIKSGTRDEVFNTAHAIQTSLGGGKYLLIVHPDGTESRYNGEIGAVHAS